MGIEALLTALPISGIEADWVAILSGFLPIESPKEFERNIYFLEPPAGQHVPFTDPVDTMTILFMRDKGWEEEVATAEALKAYAEMRPHLALLERPVLYRYAHHPLARLPECVPVPRLIDFLKQKGMVSKYLVRFLAQSLYVTMQVPSISGGHGDEKVDWAVSDLPVLPPPKSMIEFFVGVYGDLIWELSTDEDQFPDHLFLKWREDIRPRVEALERIVGKEIYYFADLSVETDDDLCHRFIALHCWCSLLPDSTFVHYLLEVTGMPDVEILKAALLAPESYNHAFEMNDAFFEGLEAYSCRFQLPEKNVMKRIGIVFNTEYSREDAAAIALQKIGAAVIFLAPEHLVEKPWADAATRYAAGWEQMPSWYVSRPVEFLTDIDFLYVLPDAERPNSGWDLKVSPEVEILIWRAHQYGFPMRYSNLMNPEVCLERRQIPEKVAQIDEERRIFLDSLGVMRIFPEYGSSGLWNIKGECVRYDLIDIPFPLARRLRLWQRNYDDTLLPILPGSPPEEWWTDHESEESGIAMELQKVYGQRVSIQIFRGGNWVNIQLLPEAQPEINNNP